VVAVSATLDHIVGRHLANIGPGRVLQDIGSDVLCALKLADCGVDAAQHEIPGEKAVALRPQATAGTETLDALLDAINEGAVWRVDDIHLFIVLGGRHGRVTVEFWHA
jgi:hypothetical protein